MRTRLLSLLSLGILGAASVAGAQPPPAQPAQPAGQPAAQPSANDPAMNMNEADMAADDEQARAHFPVARQRYQDGEFTQAAREFQQAYNLSHRPALLY